MFHLICGWLSQIKHVVCKDTAAQVALCSQIMIQAPPEAGNRAGKTGLHMQCLEAESEYQVTGPLLYMNDLAQPTLLTLAVARHHAAQRPD